MIIINKIRVMYSNIALIYGANYSNKKLIWVVLSSFVLLPLYFFLITLLSIISLILLFLFSPFYLAKIILGDTWGIDDPIMGIVMLPLSLGYYGAFLITFIPYLLIGLLSDLLAEIISSKNHNPNYVIVWPSVFAAPHKEAYPPRGF